MNFRRKYDWKKIQFIGFILFSIFILWCYMKSAGHYAAENHKGWQLLPFFWFGLTMIGAVSALYFRNSQMKAQNIDMLTKGMNESAFRQMTEELLKKSSLGYTFLIIDIKKFSQVENLYGREIGDEVLVTIYHALAANLKAGEFICRARADMFYLLINESDEEGVKKRIYALDDSVYFLETLPIQEKLFLSIGAYIIDQKNDTFAHAVDCANYCRRESENYQDRNSHMEIYGYTFQDHREREKRYHDMADIALKEGHFHMYLQPKYELVNETVAGAEALFRWIDPEQGMMPLGEFMPLFEKDGFIRQVDYFIFESALKLLQKWLDTGVRPVKISVNLSRSHFTELEFFEKKFLPIYEKYHVPKELLEFEISENILLDGAGMLIGFVKKLQKMGFSCSMDDFGSGYSSLNTLKSLPVSVIKLDGKMFGEQEKERGKIVSKGIIQIARELNIEVVAEGVETKEYVDFLKEQKCDLIQGYYFGKPMPVDDFEKVM